MQMPGSFQGSETCPSCGRKKVEPSRPCTFCGWDERRNERSCIKCGGPVNFETGPGIDRGLVIGGPALALVGYYLVGWLGALALAAAVCAIGAWYCGVYTTYRCGMCGIEARLGALKGIERRRIKSQKRLLYAVALGLLGVAGGLGFVWCSLVKHGV